MKILPGATQLALLHMQQKSLRDEYYDDPVLWAEDVLGVHLWSKQREIAYAVRDHKRTVVRASNGVGKDLPLDTPLPTPTGWTTMGEVRVGEYLIDEQGNPTKVVGKSEVQHNKLFEVVFNDGVRQVASGTHEWNTIDFVTLSRHRKKEQITDYRELWHLSETRTTQEIANTLKYNGKNNHYIPVANSFSLPEQELSIHPYILGAWLGDGHSSAAMITLGEGKQHIVGRFEQLGAPLRKLENEVVYAFTKMGFRERFREIGVFENKHIPNNYLRASDEQRLELLRGIMDTDGFYNGSSRGRATTVVGVDFMNKQLAYSVAELIRTLGARCTVSEGRTYLNGRDVGTRYRIAFNPVFDPFTPGSPKSVKRPDAGAQQSRRTVRVITGVKPIPTVATQCVQVDSPRNLYLAGENMIPTHNSFLAGVLAAWWIATRYPRDPMQTIVVTTAPSFPQIKTNVFHEFKMVMARSKEKDYPDGKPKGEAYQPLPGKINDSGNVAEWKADGSLLAIGRKPADNEIITTFQGIHRRNVLFIIDEAGGMPKDMFVAAERMTTNANAKILAVGNPDKRGSEFYKMFYDPDQKELWKKIHISSYDSPTFTGEDCPKELLDGMPTPEWVADNIKAWGGLDDPRVQIAILGDFPDSDDTVFFSEKIINEAEDADIDPNQADHMILGVDLAMHGSDESRAYLNEGGHVRLAKAWPGGTATENANIILDVLEKTQAEFVNIDSGGIGTPIIERMLELAEERGYTEFTVTMMNGSENSPDVRQWYNNRAYWYDLLRRRMLSQEVDLNMTTDLRKQLTDINYSIWETGQRAGSIIMESKRDMRKRVGYSPDDVDAIVYAIVDPIKDLRLRPDKKITYESPDEILGGEDQMPDYLQAIEGIW